MYLRLAFAVAAHLESDILIADEVLAVGDAEFQRKCLGKMRDVATSGRTVVFVSHNRAAVANLCTRAIWLESGRIQGEGAVDTVLATYLGSIQSGSEVSVKERVDREGDGRLRISNLEFLANGEPTTSFVSGDDAKIIITYETLSDTPLRHAHASVALETALGDRVALLSSLYSGDEFEELPARGKITCAVPHLPLNTGEYVCTVWITSAGRRADSLRDAAVFAVESVDFYGTGRQPTPQWGAFLPDYEWKVDSA